MGVKRKEMKLNGLENISQDWAAFERMARVMYTLEIVKAGNKVDLTSSQADKSD